MYYEFQIGLYVEANSEQEALDKLAPVLRQLEDIDPDGEAPCEMVAAWPTGGPSLERKARRMMV